MKPIQITMEENLLARLDQMDDVKQRGRSAVIRLAVEEWLARRREQEIVEEYRRAYGESGGLEDDWRGWDEEGEWLDP